MTKKAEVKELENSKSTKVKKKAMVPEGDYNLETGAPVKNSDIPVIADEKEFKEAMQEINDIMAKGDGNLTPKQTNRLRLLSLAVRNFDRAIYSVERPKTLGGVLELQKYERGWKQGQMAQALGISETKLSLIISGKQRADVIVLKAMHEKLGIDGNFILEVA